MSTSKLALYNMALGHLEQRKLASLSEGRESRRVLDDYWDQEVAWCLERHFWNFTYRTVEIDPSSSITPSFGFAFAFPIPTDWVRTRKLSASESLDPPLLQVAEENGYWYANVSPLFVQYNSNSASYGMDLSKWPPSFVDFVARRLARQSCKRITGSSEALGGREGLINQEEKARKTASANCAMNDPVGFAPTGRWVKSRRGGFGGDSPSGSLIG